MKGVWTTPGRNRECSDKLLAMAKIAESERKVS
jgi:hypothetical protein